MSLDPRSLWAPKEKSPDFGAFITSLLCKFLSTSKASPSCGFSAAFFFPVLSSPAVSFILVETLKLHHSYFQISGNRFSSFWDRIERGKQCRQPACTSMVPTGKQPETPAWNYSLGKAIFGVQKIVMWKILTTFSKLSFGVCQQGPWSQQRLQILWSYSCQREQLQLSALSAVCACIYQWYLCVWWWNTPHPFFSSWQEKGRLFGASFNVAVWPKQGFMISGETVASTLGFFFFLTFFFNCFPLKFQS